MASERPGWSSWRAAQASTFAMNWSVKRSVRVGAFPVAGRPLLLGVAFLIDLIIINAVH